jgi:alpha-tubulin suppressor-like RCC1 family protein/serine/threonine protein kinase
MIAAQWEVAPGANSMLIQYIIGPVKGLDSTSVHGVTALRIAEGGMGYIEVVARKEGRFSRLFARKRLHPALRADPALRAMFLDEARLAGLIRHPNVVAVLEVGDDEDGPYFLMDYVEGPTVAQILERVEPRERLLPIALCVSIVAQAARGLHAAHQLVSNDGTPLDLIHRDISPKNLLVGYDGLVRVADFGIAKAKDNVEQTRLGVLKGNVGYMAPEYLRFERLDRRSDLFALGIVLYELLTRERMYAGDDGAAIARRILDEPPLDIFEVRDVPPELAALLFDLLAKEREVRPVDALAVATALDSIAANVASAEGPFDISAFLESELQAMREERKMALDGALSAMAAPSNPSATLPATTMASPTPRGGAKRSWRGYAAGIAVLVVAATATALMMRRNAPSAPLPPFGDPALWTGGWHTCALRDNELACWGSNIRGQLGDGTLENRHTPVAARIESVREVAMGEYHTCVVAAEGKVSCWGRNVRGEIGRSSASPVKSPVEVPEIAHAMSLAAGRQHTCALLAGGAVSCWGANESGQVGRPPSGDAEPPALVADLPPATHVFAGGSNSCALLDSGGVACWGANESGQLVDGTRNARSTPARIAGVGDVVDLAIGNAARAGSKNPDLTKSAGFMCAVTSSGQVFCWGNNSTGQLGDGTRDDRSAPTVVAGISDAIQIGAGDVHACALLRSGGVSCWGRNEFGAVGDDSMGPSTVRPTPVAALGIQDAIGIALGGAHSCARRRAGGILCWGVNNFGQLGDGSMTLHASPHPVRGFP